MHLSQLFFRMLTLKALTSLNVTDRYGRDLIHIDTHQPCRSVHNNPWPVKELQLTAGKKNFIKINDFHMSA